MPKQIFNKDDFIKLADGAWECLVVRREDKVKIKLRRSRLMYIYVTNSSEADEVLKEIKVDKVEL
ncbi:MAG: hypothetical protein ACE5KA_08375 [Nitrososphaerales archaeon]